MSYAKWTYSPFHIRASARGGHKFCWEAERVSINEYFEFTAKQLEEDMDKCISAVLSLPITNPRNLGYGVSIASLKAELKTHLERFLCVIKEVHFSGVSNRPSLEEMQEILKLCNLSGREDVIFTHKMLDRDHIQWRLHREYAPYITEEEVLKDFESKFLRDLLRFSYEERCKIFGKECP